MTAVAEAKPVPMADVDPSDDVAGPAAIADGEPAAAPQPVDGKHPLENTWVLWYDSRRLHSQNASEKWEDNLHMVATMDTVEDFWSAYNYIKRPSALEFGANYHMFKKGITPMWEDKANCKGGKWVLTLTVKQDADRLSDLWELLLLSMIGEYLDEGVGGDHVCGAVLSRRKAMTKVSLWTRDASEKPALAKLGARLRQVMGLHDDSKLEYQNHNDALQTGSSFQNQVRLTA